jgi:hypothetical protein
VKKVIAILAALPIAAFAQAGQPREAPRGPGMGQGGGMGPGGRPNAEFVQKRARLALTLGLAMALDLDEAQALRLGDVVAKSLDRRRAIHEQLRGAHDTLKKAAQGEKVAAAEVDQAIAKILDGRAQIQAIDRELVGSVTQGLTPDKKARAVLFLGRFQRRFGRGGPGMHPGMHPGMMHGPGGPGGHGMMRGGDRTGMELEPGPGAMVGMCLGGDCDWDDEG